MMYTGFVVDAMTAKIYGLVVPRCTAQASSTCAGVFPTRAAIAAPSSCRADGQEPKGGFA
jgi:hypothetical protein